MTDRNELERLMETLTSMGLTIEVAKDAEGRIDVIRCNGIAQGRPLSPLSFAEYARPIAARRRREA